MDENHVKWNFIIGVLLIVAGVVPALFGMVVFLNLIPLPILGIAMIGYGIYRVVKRRQLKATCAARKQTIILKPLASLRLPKEYDTFGQLMVLVYMSNKPHIAKSSDYPPARGAMVLLLRFSLASGKHQISPTHPTQNYSQPGGCQGKPESKLSAIISLKLLREVGCAGKNRNLF